MAEICLLFFDHDSKGYRECWPGTANSIVFGFAESWRVETI